MLQNAYFLARIGGDTAENEQHFAENLPKNGNYPTALTGVPVPGSYDAEDDHDVAELRVLVAAAERELREAAELRPAPAAEPGGPD